MYVPISGESAHRHPFWARLKAAPGALTQQHIDHLVSAGILSLVRHEDGLVDIEVQHQPRLDCYVLLIQTCPASPCVHIPEPATQEPDHMRKQGQRCYYIAYLCSSQRPVNLLYVIVLSLVLLA